MTGLFFSCHLRTVIQNAKHRTSQHWQTKGKVCQERKTSRDILWRLLNNKQKAFSELGSSHSTMRVWYESAGAATFYLSSDSAGEPPHGFVRSVVLTPTPHLKWKRHCVSFHLKQDTDKTDAPHAFQWNVFTVDGCAQQIIITLTRSLGHPVPNTLRLPYPRVFPPYSVTLRLLVLGPA